MSAKTKHAKFKVGTRVSCPHRSGKRYEGRVDGNDVLGNGPWVRVNIAPKGMNRILKTFRPSQLIVVA